MHRPAFDIGLTMAGAVSAGAYTAGVIDFLFEALDAIDDVRAGRDTRYLDGSYRDQNKIIDPPHDVRIRAMSGTSAGSMAGAIVAAVLGTRVQPVTSGRAAEQTDPTGNPLYDCWVNDIHYDKLLSTTDIDEPDSHVVSLLNAAPLETIVTHALTYASKNDYVRHYIGDRLQIFFCVSNLRGVRYGLKLIADEPSLHQYQMSLHADWVGFAWKRAAHDDTALVPGGDSARWQKLGDTALASGAFPVGLSARLLVRPFLDYEQRHWFDHAGKAGGTYPPLDKSAQFKNGEYHFVNADGGVFNNEPLELCRAAIAGGPGHHNPRDPLEAHRGIILIDPFPNLTALEEPYAPKSHRQLLNVVQSLFAAILAQARFKLDELALANEPNVASRYAIMPVRYDAVGKAADYALACGSLGGFGGFLSRAFRHHDFMLGRRNCQRFLAMHFVLPADWDSDTVNPLFREWQGKQFTGDFQVIPDAEPGDPYAAKKYLPIIPLLGKLASDQYTAMPAWPATPFDLKACQLKRSVLARADAVKASLVRQYNPNLLVRIGLAVVWWWYKARWVESFVIDTVRKDLAKRGIHLS